MKNITIGKLKIYLVCIATFLTTFSGSFVSAKDYSFSWAENDGVVEGYRLYYKVGGTASVPFDGIRANEGCSPIDIGNATSFTISGLDETEIYHFTLTAYSGNDESDFTQVITVFPEDEKSRRVKLALPVILEFLLDS